MAAAVIVILFDAPAFVPPEPLILTSVIVALTLPSKVPFKEKFLAFMPNEFSVAERVGVLSFPIAVTEILIFESSAETSAPKSRFISMFPFSARIPYAPKVLFAAEASDETSTSVVHVHRRSLPFSHFKFLYFSSSYSISMTLLSSSLGLAVPDCSSGP